MGKMGHMSKRHAMILAVGMLASASALAQTETIGQAGPRPATAGTVPTTANPAHAAAPKTAAPAAASTAESRSVAALALTHEPTYDEGSAQRIKDAALSYSDIAVPRRVAGDTRRGQIRAGRAGTA